MKNPKFDFKDITIVPETISTITSRKEVNPYNELLYLPVMVSPMDTVVDEKNYKLFEDNLIPVCMPRGHYDYPGTFKSISLDEFETYVNWYIENENFGEVRILVDIANGHIEKLHKLCKKFVKNKKDKNHVLMVGNIANPKTYKELAKIGVDYVRVGIGGGCFIDGTQVKTINGDKNIEDINIGDKVLTHTGEFKQVLDLKKIEYQGDLIKINNNITCTPDHQFYALNKKYIGIVNDENIHNLCEWVSVEELTKNSNYLLVEHIDKQ